QNNYQINAPLLIDPDNDNQPQLNLPIPIAQDNHIWKQGPTEDVDSYHILIEELLHHIESGSHHYPGTTKAQMFINGLRPELATSVSSFMPNSLTATYKKAKAFENSFKQNLFYNNPYLSSLHLYPPSDFASHGPYKLVNQQNCSNPLPQVNSAMVATGSNGILLGQNNGTRNNSLTNNNSSQNRDEAQTFFNLHVEEEDPLFFLVEESDRLANSTCSKKRHVEVSTLSELLNEKKALDEIREVLKQILGYDEYDQMEELLKRYDELFAWTSH
ncbi:18935_t:CDS:2, partial [Gigaspora rosea]